MPMAPLTQGVAAEGGDIYGVALTVGDLNGDGVADISHTGNSPGGLGIRLSNTEQSYRTLSRLRGVNVLTRQNSLAALATLNAYSEELNAVTTAIGASLSRTNTAGNVLAATTENYKAANARIVDVDVASESSRMVQKQILQQTGTSILAQANQQPQIVLGLLNRV